MALTLSKTGITNNSTIEAAHVTQSIDALTGLVAYDITVSGSYYVVGPITASGNIIPGATTTYNLGAPGRYFLQTYTNGLTTNGIASTGPITGSIIKATSYFEGNGNELQNIKASGSVGSVQFRNSSGLMVGASDFTYDSGTKTLTSQNVVGTASWADRVSGNVPLQTQVVLGGTYTLQMPADKYFITVLTGSSNILLDVTAGGGLTPNEQYVFIRNGAEEVEVTSSDSSVTFLSADGNKRINRQYSAITLVTKDFSTMYIIGDLKA